MSSVHRPSSRSIRSARRLGIALLVAAAAGCTPTDAVVGPETEVPEIGTVRVLPESAQVTVGQRIRLSVDVRDNQGRWLPNERITWSSSNTGVATVDDSGAVQLVGTGLVEIRATTRGNKGATARVAAAPVPVATVRVSPSSTSLQAGQTLTLAATTLSAADSLLPGRTVTWTSSNTTVATVDAAGTVTARVAGSATITATSEGVAGTAALAVTALPAPGAVSTLAATATSDTTVTLAFTDAGNGLGGPASYLVRLAAGTSISWASAAAPVRGTCASAVTASALGGAVSCTIRGLSASTAYRFLVMAYRGTVGTDAVYGGVSNTASATTAQAAVATVTLSPANASVVAGQGTTLAATARDAAGTVLTGRTVTWSSLNTAVATVSTSGVVTGVAAGSTTIRATVGGVAGNATVTVTAPPAPTVASVSVDPRSAAVVVGQTVTLAATARDAGGAVMAGQTATWSSLSPGVATVSSAGVVTGVAAGTATIRASIAGITSDASVTVSAAPTAAGFANEPAGFVALGQWNNATTFDVNGWYDDGNPSGWGGKTIVTSGYAGTPRIGGSRVTQTLYRGGVEGGHDAGRIQFDLPANTNELFFAAEVQFKADYPTSTSSGGNKQFFVTFSGGGRYFINMDEGLANGRWGVYVGSSPLADSNIPVVYGQWVKVEWYLNRNTGNGDGVMRLWIDGVLALNLTNLTFPTGTMRMAYDDGSNNGNHLVEGDTRSIRYEHGATVDAYRWTSALYASTRQP